MRAPTSSRSRRTTRSSPPVATASTARSPTSRRSATTRRATAASNGLPVRTRNVLQQHLGPGPRRHDAVGRRPEGRRPDRRADRPQLATFDVLDRYDFDGDGEFDEPDGYLDRFQIVHAGGDQADGDPIHGEDAIWSHRWYVDHPDRRRPARRTTGRRHPDRHTPASGSATTPSRPRTAGCRRSPTSTATTWACPTTTTPLRSARQPGQLVDADGAEPGLRPGRPGHRHPRRRPRRVGQAAARLARLRDGRGRAEAHACTSARTSTTARRRRASPWCCRTRRSTDVLPAPVEGSSSGGAARATATPPR